MDFCTFLSELPKQDANIIQKLKNLNDGIVNYEKNNYFIQWLNRQFMNVNGYA